MFKKIFAIVLAVSVMSFVFSGCQKPAEDAAAAPAAEGSAE
ncbi:MAG: hypothetical protein SNJ76_01730 [Fimbriimonadaceae bacterium]